MDSYEIFQNTSQKSDLKKQLLQNSLQNKRKKEFALLSRKWYVQLHHF